EQSVEDLSNLKEQWLFFLKYAKELAAVPSEMSDVPALQQAFEFANQANLTPEELEDLEHWEMFLHDQRNALKLARRQGLEEGAERETALILRLLGRKLGVLTEDLQTQVNRLELAVLESLGEALFDFEGIEDLREWLAKPQREE
ncbi:MAG: DUF4351 domain-containing protein, partial [Cyanobacteria bacterium J06626_18]